VVQVQKVVCARTNMPLGYSNIVVHAWSETRSISEFPTIQTSRAKINFVAIESDVKAACEVNREKCLMYTN